MGNGCVSHVDAKPHLAHISGTDVQLDYIDGVSLYPSAMAKELKGLLKGTPKALHNLGSGDVPATADQMIARTDVHALEARSRAIALLSTLEGSGWIAGEAHDSA